MVLHRRRSDEPPDGQRTECQHRPARASSIDHGLAITSHSTQGQIADRVLINIDTELGANDHIKNRISYVSVSRGAHDAQIFTTDREKLPGALSRDVSHQSARVPEIAKIADREIDSAGGAALVLRSGAALRQQALRRRRVWRVWAVAGGSGVARGAPVPGNRSARRLMSDLITRSVLLRGIEITEHLPTWRSGSPAHPSQRSCSVPGRSQNPGFGSINSWSWAWPASCAP